MAFLEKSEGAHWLSFFVIEILFGCGGAPEAEAVGGEGESCEDGCDALHYASVY